MKLYRIAKLVSSGDIIFGLVNKSGVVDSKVVSEQMRKQHLIVSHQKLFGFAAINANDSWRCDSAGKVYWYSEPKEEIKHAVENHLFRNYGLTNINHSFPAKTEPNPIGKYF